jgi:hypothetical protein
MERGYNRVKGHEDGESSIRILAEPFVPLRADERT